MLVSVKKRRGPLTGEGGKVRLVAERCFNLSEIVVVDLKDGGGQSSSYLVVNSLLTSNHRRTEQRYQDQAREGDDHLSDGETRRQESTAHGVQEGRRGAIE